MFSYPAYTYLRRHTQTLSGVFGYANASWKKALVVKLKGRNTFANGIVVTGGYFSGLDVRPAAGCLITPSDEKPDARPVVDISYQFWTREFARSRSAIGQALTIDGSPFTIAGVTPPQFFGTEPRKAPDFWEPIGQWEGIRHDMANMFTDRTSATYWWLTLMGRVKPGIRRDRARSELNILFQQSLTATPDHSIEASELPILRLSPGERGTASLRQMFSHSLLLWMLIAGLALLAACANVAVLMPARAESRWRPRPRPKFIPIPTP